MYFVAMNKHIFVYCCAVASCYATPNLPRFGFGQEGGDNDASSNTPLQMQGGKNNQKQSTTIPTSVSQTNTFRVEGKNSLDVPLRSMSDWVGAAPAPESGIEKYEVTVAFPIGTLKDNEIAEVVRDGVLLRLATSKLRE